MDEKYKKAEMTSIADKAKEQAIRYVWVETDIEEDGSDNYFTARENALLLGAQEDIRFLCKLIDKLRED